MCIRDRCYNHKLNLIDLIPLFAYTIYHCSSCEIVHFVLSGLLWFNPEYKKMCSKSLFNKRFLAIRFGKKNILFIYNKIMDERQMIILMHVLQTSEKLVYSN